MECLWFSEWHCKRNCVKIKLVCTNTPRLSTRKPTQHYCISFSIASYILTTDVQNLLQWVIYIETALSSFWCNFCPCLHKKLRNDSLSNISVSLSGLWLLPYWWLVLLFQYGCVNENKVSYGESNYCNVINPQSHKLVSPLCCIYASVFRSALVQIMVCYLSAPSHYLNQSRVIVNWTLRNKLQLNVYQSTKRFIHGNASEYIVCKRRPFCPGEMS